MKSIDQLSLIVSGTAKGTGFSRTRRFWGLIRGSVPAPDKFNRPVCGARRSLSHCADAGNTNQSPSSAGCGSVESASPQSGHSRCKLGLIAVAGLADAEHPASQTNTYAPTKTGKLKRLPEHLRPEFCCAEPSFPARIAPI